MAARPGTRRHRKCTPDVPRGGQDAPDGRSGSHATLPPGKVDHVFFDAELAGLGLRVRASGAKTWMVQYAIAGKTRRMALGSTAVLDPGKARETAKDLLAQVRLGRDPAGEKVTSRAKAAETFGAHCQVSWNASARV